MTATLRPATTDDIPAIEALAVAAGMFSADEAPFLGAQFRAAGHDTADITAMGICIIRCCRVLLRPNGSLAHPAINWMDERLDHPHADEEQYGER